MGEFFEQLQKVWPLLMSAPWGFAPLFAVLLLAGWFAGRFAFGERIANLKSRLEMRDEKIEALSWRLLEQDKTPPKPDVALQPNLPPPTPQIAKPAQEAAIPKNAGKSASLRDIVLGKKWLLYFGPSAAGGKKVITFLPDGSIGEGRNSNEDRWAIEGAEGDILSIYRSNGAVQNVFYYSEKSGNFPYMPDSRARGVKNQFIELKA